MLTFQQLIMTLQQYWAEQGCVIMQPYDMEVGAGTFHPATFLAAVGPEPIRAAYVQPSRRPADGRYGDNFQDLYLGSLTRLGLDMQKDDIRFVEDDWESPTLGAWGLGWEIWLNGMEVSQFTYFQQVGGRDCRPVSGEITYGLERIAMFLQGVESVFDLVWNQVSKSDTAGQYKYGDLYLQNEREQSAYNFDHADVGILKEQFDSAETTARQLLEKNLSLPAYEQVLKASHTFNLLDARGVIAVTERQAYIGRIRALAKGCCEAWLARQGAADG